MEDALKGFAFGAQKVKHSFFRFLFIYEIIFSLFSAFILTLFNYKIDIFLIIKGIISRLLDFKSHSRFNELTI